MACAKIGLGAKIYVGGALCAPPSSYYSSNRSTPTLAQSFIAVDPTSVMSFMDGNVKDIFEVDREASGAAPQLSRDIIMGAAVKVIG